MARTRSLRRGWEVTRAICQHNEACATVSIASRFVRMSDECGDDRTAERRPTSECVELDLHADGVAVTFRAAHTLRHWQEGAPRLLAPDAGLPGDTVDGRAHWGPAPRFRGRGRVSLRHRREGPAALAGVGE